MTQQQRIDPKKAKETSLLERADKAFGLESLGPAKVPDNLRQVEKRVPKALRRDSQMAATRVAPSQPARSVESTPAADQTEVKQPTQDVPVKFSGPRQKIDRERLREAGLIVPEDPVTGLLEEFRIVKRELLADARASGDPTAQRILVCSPHSGEGKTYCATNLAIALAAERDVEVLLVDSDVVNPSVARRLGITAEKGLMDTLATPSLRPESLAVATDIDRLFVLPAGKSTSRDAEYLASARTGEVLDRLTRSAPNRFVIFDTPPALAASPAAELAAYVGQAVLVVRADQTSQAALEDAQQLLSACPDIKLLLNAAQYSPSGRRFGEYAERED